MKQMYRSLAALAAMALAGACADSPTAPGEIPPESIRGGRTGGSALAAQMSATGFFEQQFEYDWTLEKRVKDILDGNMLPEPSLSETIILPGQVKWLHYELTGTRTLAGKHRLTGARGEICLRNVGDAETENLSITSLIQRKSNGEWVTHASAPVSVAANPQLDPGENHCFPYETRLEAEAGEALRSAARVTVTNHTGHSGSEYGPGLFITTVEDETESTGLYSDFAIPATATITTKDEKATVTDRMDLACANVFPSIICTGAGGFQPVVLTQTTTYIGASTVDFYNYVICGQEFPITNHAKIVESGPYPPGVEPEFDEASATVVVKTGECPPQPANPGCTLTQGYWKNHAWPAHPMWGPSTLATWPDILGYKFFDTALEWPEVLDVSPGGDAYFILAHQYIAASLNQQNGAYVPEAVRQALVAAYEYFSLRPAERATIDRAHLISLATILDRYNNGLLGVPHCD